MTEAERVAVKIAQVLNNLELDLDEVGIHLARIKPTTHYNRVMLVAESAVEEREKLDDNTYRY